MLTIKPAQFDLLATRAAQSFRARLRRHLQRFFPDHCETLGPERVDLAIEFAIQRAAFHGLESEHAACVYADLVFAFGHRFDEDPKHPWAAAVLADPDIRDPADRVDRLHAAAIVALRRG